MSPCESCKVNETLQVIGRVEDKKVQQLLEILAKKQDRDCTQKGPGQGTVP